MLYKKLTEEELEFMECWYDPICMTECLIPENIKAPQIWSNPDCKMIKVRPYQFAMIDYSVCYADDDTLKPEVNFAKKKGAGFLINVAARNLGKSLFAFIDGFLTLLYGEADESCIASFDYDHLTKLGTPIANLANYHPFFQLYRRKGKECVRWKAGGLIIDTILGHFMYGRNENINSPDPGVAFHSLHVKKNIYDEVSYMTDKGRKKMTDALHSEGCIERWAGIPDVRLGSPLGRVLTDTSKKNWICNMPQFVREDWNEQTNKEKIEEYEGETSPMYKLNVLGEAIEGENSMFDMARIKESSYHLDRNIKQFEVGKETFSNFRDILIIEPQPGAITIVAGDIGTVDSPTEITIFFGDKDLYKWRYNITLYMLTTQEQEEIFEWLYKKFDNCVISIDCTEGSGRAICDGLEIKRIPKDRIVRCRMGSNMIVGFEMNEPEEGKEPTIKTDDKGEPIYKLERTIDFANLELGNLLYHGKIDVPHSEKFLREFANYFSVTTGTTKRYGTRSTDHMLQSFQCMAVCRFLNEVLNSNKPQNPNTFVAGF